MKKIIGIFIMVMVSLFSTIALAAVDNSAFFEAKESISITTNDPFNEEKEVTVVFTDLSTNMFFQGFYLAIDGEPSGDSIWDMYISESYPSIVRWLNDEGSAIQIDLSLEEPLTMISYIPANEMSVLSYDQKNGKIFEMTPFGQSEIALENAKDWVSVSLGARSDGSTGFSVIVMDMKALMANSAQTPDTTEEVEESPYKPEQFLGDWHCKEIKRILQISLNDVWLRDPNGAGWGFNTPFTLSGQELIVRGLGTFHIRDIGGKFQLICTESDYIAENMIFTMEDEIISFEELTSQTWVNQAANETITFENGTYKYKHSSGSSHSGSTSMVYLVGDTVYLTGAGAEFVVEKDDGIIKLIGETGEFTSLSNTANKPDHIKIDGVFVNESYKNEDHDSMTQVVLCYTLTSTGENYKVVGNNSSLTFKGGNTYQAGHSPKACLYLGNYYYGSSYVQNVYYGEELKLVDTFEIPRAELKAGRAFSLKNRYIDGMDYYELTTDEIVFCEDMQAIAQMVDPEGYEKMLHALAEADSKTKEKIRGYVNGYYWDFFVNNISYRLEFGKSSYTLQSMGFTTTGKYTICNGYIILTNDSTGAKNYLPYEVQNNDIKLDVTTGFDVLEN